MKIAAWFAPGLRPPSIVRFERLYLASFLVSLIGWAASWQATADRLAIDPRTAPFGWLLPAALLFSAAVTLLLWYLIARRGNVIAKWIVTVLTGMAALRFVLNLMVVMKGPVPITAILLSFVIVALGVAATVQLFRPDTRLWFGEIEDVEGEDS